MRGPWGCLHCPIVIEAMQQSACTNRHLIGDGVAYHDMMSAWDHDDGWVASALAVNSGSPSVWPMLPRLFKSKIPCRLCRGVAVERARTPPARTLVYHGRQPPYRFAGLHSVSV